MAWFPPHYLSASPFPSLPRPAAAETHGELGNDWHFIPTRLLPQQVPNPPTSGLPPWTRPQLLAEARCKALTLSASSEIGPIQTSAASLHPLFFFSPLNTLIHTASMRPEPDAIQDSCKSDEKSLLHSCSVVKLESKERTRASFQPLCASNIYKPVELASFGLTIIIQITPLDYKRQDFTPSLAIVKHPASGRTQGGRHQKKNSREKKSPRLPAPARTVPACTYHQASSPGLSASRVHQKTSGLKNKAEEKR